MPLQNSLPRIAYFVSSHGFGHAARTRSILREIHGVADISVFSNVPEWFWGDLTVRHVQYRADVGCVQRETLVIDESATRVAYQQFENEKPSRFAEFSRQHSVSPFDLIVTDIAPEPLEFASLLGIRSVLIANFTWLEIYAGMASMHSTLPTIKEQYVLADAIYIPSFQTGMTWATNARVVGAVAERGKCIRHHLNPDSKYGRMVYVDAGRWGAPIGWQNAVNFEDTLFIRIGATLEGLPNNVLQLDFGAVRHADLVTSVDLVVSKPGYGIVTECLANNTPWACIEREGFAEDAVLIQAAQETMTEFIVAHDQLESLAFPSVYVRRLALGNEFDGAQQVANRLATMLSTDLQ